MSRGRRRRSPATSTRPCKGRAGIGHGAKSMRTIIVRLTAAPKGRGGVISDPADGLELAGGPRRLPAVPQGRIQADHTHLRKGTAMKIGFIGLGNMGQAMARNIAR